MLGAVLVHQSGGVRRAGTIVETEAYAGPDDAASHARRGPTKRAAIMFGEPGHAYVYLIYGVHHCFNAVTERDGHPGAVLVRAVDVEGAELGSRAGSGPGLVCRALDIDRSCTGLDLTGDTLILERGREVADADVSTGPRIGVDYAGEWAQRPWRFWITSSTAVSRRKPAGEPYIRTNQRDLASSRR